MDEIFLSSILIFMPKNYYLLFKLAIFETISVIKIKSNWFESLKYLDDFFNNWQNH